MSDVTIDDGLISMVKPVVLPDTISDIWQRFYLQPLLRWLPVPLEHYRPWSGRPNCGHFFGGCFWYGWETGQTALALATAWRAADALGVESDVDMDLVLETTVAGLRYLGFTHAAGPDDCVRVACPNPLMSQRKWGGEGDPFFMASQTGVAVSSMGLAAWLLWDRLDDETRQLTLNVLQWYADRWTYEKNPSMPQRPDFWRSERDPKVGTYGDSQIEENGWTAQPIDLAACMMPDHPHQQRWRNGADAWAANIATTPFDTHRNAATLQGKPVCDWAAGVTVHPDFTVENHGYVNPGYQSAGIRFATSIILQHALAGLDTPEVARHNMQPLYATLKRMTERDGIFLAVQGQSWFYLTHYGNTVTHAQMNVGFGDPHAAYLERLGAERALEVMNSLQNRHLYVNNPEQCTMTSSESLLDMEFEAMAGYAEALLMHWCMGDGAEPCTEEQFTRWQAGVSVFPHGGVVLRHGRQSRASFSWRNRPSVTVQPADGSWVVTPDPFNLSGTFVCDPPWQGRFGAVDGTRRISHSVIEDGESFSAITAQQRQGGRLVQHLALMVPSDEVAFFFDRTTAAEPVTVVEQLSGQVTVRNEDYPAIPHLASGRRTLYVPDDEFISVSGLGPEDEWFFSEPPAWANLDDIIGYVVFGSKGLAYHARHTYSWYRGIADYLYLSCERQPRQYGAGELVSNLAIAIYPNQASDATRQQVQAVLRARHNQEADALLTREWLACANFSDRPLSCRLQFEVPSWGLLPVPDGCTAIWDGKLSYDRALGKHSADLRQCRMHVSTDAPWEATATETGRRFVKLLGEQPADLRIMVGGRQYRLTVHPRQIVEL